MKLIALAIAKEEYKTPWAATAFFHQQVKGNSEEAKRRRLHSKFQKRRQDLLAEARRTIDKEKEDDEPSLEFMIAEQLAGKSKETKVKALTAYFRAWRENWEVYERVGRGLRRSGITWTIELEKSLLGITLAMQHLEEKWPNSEEKITAEGTANFNQASNLRDKPKNGDEEK